MSHHQRISRWQRWRCCLVGAAAVLVGLWSSLQAAAILTLAAASLLSVAHQAAPVA